MTADSIVKAKSKAHVIYKNSDGTRLPGVTTVLGILNKPALVKWANNLGLQGIDSNKYRDEMADIGTLAHRMILDHFSQQKTDTSEYSPDQVELAENCLLSFYEWEKGHKLEVILAEAPLVSDELGYGGTVDCYCNLDGVPTLLDFKTGKAIYSEAIHQLAAYADLLGANNHSVAEARVLRIGRDDNEGFEEKLVKNLDKHFEIFEHCLAIYNLQKEVK